MPTSARRSPDCRRGAEAGLTLVEMLVVLAIIAVASGAAMLSFGGDGGPRAADAEARKLAIALQRASDDALVASRPASIAWTAEGYAVAGAARALPEDVRLSSTATSPARLGGDGVGPSIEWTLTAGGTARTVRYDGLNAAVAP